MTRKAFAVRGFAADDVKPSIHCNHSLEHPFGPGSQLYGRLKQGGFKVPKNDALVRVDQERRVGQDLASQLIKNLAHSVLFGMGRYQRPDSRRQAVQMVGQNALSAQTGSCGCG